MLFFYVTRSFLPQCIDGIVAMLMYTSFNPDFIPPSLIVCDIVVFSCAHQSCTNQQYSSCYQFGSLRFYHIPYYTGIIILSFHHNNFKEQMVTSFTSADGP